MTSRLRQLILLLFLCVLFLNGCRGKMGVHVKEVKKSPTEETKSELLRRISRRFEDPESHYELGALYHNDGMWAQAETEYNITLSLDPVHRKAQAAMVKLLFGSKEVEKAELLADIYMNQASSSAMGSLKLALAFQKQELDDYALRNYQQALHLAPNSARINKQIGYYYLSKNDIVRAQEYLSRSFQLDSSDAEVAGELGRLGVAVRIPRKSVKATKQLDRTVDQSVTPVE